ncbi:hypothetical protein [Paraburkholderia sp. J41]|uniref:hypothetical protein n=1 Tax=Paraburkholderia sp. J41 TaxID=2805433 RepID=UPI002AC36E90|nr:hypothetical protein [Paraburkholderia sp. J41]
MPRVERRAGMRKRRIPRGVRRFCLGDVFSARVCAVSCAFVRFGFAAPAERCVQKALENSSTALKKFPVTGDRANGTPKRHAGASEVA